MTRKDFKQIIKLRSVWKIDRRKGNYKLPSGSRLFGYVEHLVDTQLKLDRLAIRSNGDLCVATGGTYNTETGMFDDIVLMPPFEENETCSYEEMEKRINKLIREIIG